MRILLVTFTEYLPFAFTQVLNPELEYCAIVVDEPEPAKNFGKCSAAALKKFSCPKN